MSNIKISTTDFVHFDRISDGRWKLRTQLASHGLTVEVRYEFTRDPRGPIWAAERQAMQAAYEAIGEWLRHQPGQGEPSAPHA